MSSGEDKVRAKIKELEAEYARTQKNKATEGHLGLIKAKLSKLRRELTEFAAGGVRREADLVSVVLKYLRVVIPVLVLWASHQ